MRRTHAVIIALFVVAFTGLACMPLTRDVMRSGTDILFWLRGAASMAPLHRDGEVAVIAVDERTYRTPPFAGLPRVLWAPQIAQVMQAVLGADPTVVGWDIVFPTSAASFLGDQRFDLPLLQIFARERGRGRIVLGATQLGDEPILPNERMRWAIGHSVNIRSLNLHTDPDGIVRAVPLFVQREAEGGVVSEPAFALELANRHRGTGDVGPNLQAAGDNILLLNYGDPPGGVPTYSFADLWHCAEQGRTDFFETAFAGKAVVFGTVLDVEDRVPSSARLVTRPDGEGWPAPCTQALPARSAERLIARGTVPGVYLQATAISNLLNGDYLNEVPGWAVYLIVLVVAGVCGLAVMRFHPLGAGIVWLTVSLVWSGVALALFARGFDPPLFEPVLASALTFAFASAFRVSVVDRNERHIRKAFGYYMAPALLERLVESREMPALGGEERDITVLFSDLAGFTSLSEETAPQDTVSLLNDYFTELTDVVEAHGGYVERYYGDGMLALFGAPLADGDDRRHAVEAALACQARLAEVGDRLAFPAGAVLHTRIGINSGRMVVGNIGSVRRLNYTVIGDAVNLAARLEGANKIYGTRILISDTTAASCGAGVVLREIDTVRVVGRAAPVPLFDPVGLDGAVPTATLVKVARYGAALRAYRAGRFEEAAALFDALAPSDPPAAAMARRARALQTAPPDAVWDGVVDLDTK